jgi:hypothetical protein
MEGTRISMKHRPCSPSDLLARRDGRHGKSAIARSFCRFRDEKSLLGGSFFCLRGNESRANVKRISPTLAWFLIHRDPDYQSSLALATQSGFGMRRQVRRWSNLSKDTTDFVRSATFSPDGTRIVTIQITDVMPGEVVMKTSMRTLTHLFGKSSAETTVPDHILLHSCRASSGGWIEGPAEEGQHMMGGEVPRIGPLDHSVSSDKLPLCDRLVEGNRDMMTNCGGLPMRLSIHPMGVMVRGL